MAERSKRSLYQILLEFYGATDELPNSICLFKVLSEVSKLGCGGELKLHTYQDGANYMLKVRVANTEDVIDAIDRIVAQLKSK